MKSSTNAEISRVLQSGKKLTFALLHLVSSTLWPKDESKKMRVKPIPGKVIFVLCLACFLAGSLLDSQRWTNPNSEYKDNEFTGFPIHVQKLNAGPGHKFEHKRVSLVVLNFCK